MTASLPERVPVLRALIDICGPDFARSARSVDAVDGRRATFVAVPATTNSVVDTLRLAADRGLAVLPRGSGSKIDWGRPRPGVDLIVDTGRLGGLWDHRPDELTAEVGTGTPVRALQAALALRGQRLAVDPASRGATVGGMLAVNESGPLRHRFGTAAEQVTAISYVDLEGVAGESDGEGGRPGIAEVSGVLLSATVRLQPLPAARRWVTVPVITPLQMPSLVQEVLELELDPSAIEIDLPAARVRPTAQPPGTLAILLEGEKSSIAEHAVRLADVVGYQAAVSDTAPVWWGRYPFGPTEVALRISAPVGELHAALYAISDAAAGPVPVRGSAGAGSVLAVLPASFGPERIERILDTLRQVLLARGGRAVIIAAPRHIAHHVDMADRRELF